MTAAARLAAALAAALTPAAVAAAEDRSMVSAAQTMAETFRMRLAEQFGAMPRVLAETEAVLIANSPDGTAGYFLEVIGWTLGFLVLGHLLARYLVYIPLLRPRYARLLERTPRGIGDKLPVLTLRALMAGVTLGVAMLVALVLGASLFPAPPNPATEKTLVILFAAWALGFGLVTLWRLILAPNLGAFRLPAIGGDDARQLFRWLSAASVLAVAVHAWCVWMFELGLGENVHAVVVSVLTLLAVALTVVAIRLNRQAVTCAFLGGRQCEGATGPAAILAALWGPAAVVYVVGSWAEMTYRLIMGTALGMPPILGFYLVVAVMLAVYGVALFAIDRYFRGRRLRAMRARRAEGLPAAESVELPPPGPLPSGGVSSFEDLAIRVAGILAAASGVAALMWIWEAQKLPMMRESTSQAMTLLTVVLLGYVAHEAARIAIDRRIALEGGPQQALEPGDEGGGAQSFSRLATLLPLIRTGVLVTIIIIAGAMVLVELGVNIAPIFAGAGVIGIAVGFGAQYLIRDIFAGIFFLIDDAFRRGEYIEVGEVKGTVENISIRSFQLRHHLGPLQTIPFGEIKTMTNYSRDWVVMKLPLRVTYDTDVEKVRRLVKKLGQELLQDPEIGDQFLQPLKSQGVIEMQDSAMIIRVKFTTKPGDQWAIRQRVYMEIRELFQREGIRFAHREVTVRVAEDAPPLTPAQREAIKAAALDLDAAADTPPGMMPAAAQGR